MIEKIHANAQLVIEQLRKLSGIDFGYNTESVEWLEGYIERLRSGGEFQNDPQKDKLISVVGSFLGECIVRCYGGVWMEKDDSWGVRFGAGEFRVSFCEGVKANGEWGRRRDWGFFSRDPRHFQRRRSTLEGIETEKTVVAVMVGILCSLKWRLFGWRWRRKGNCCRNKCGSSHRFSNQMVNALQLRHDISEPF